MKTKYKVIALVGPSGCGKDTILNKVLCADKETKYFNRVVSYSSRPIRMGEEEGVAYHFVNPETFLDFFNDNSIVEMVEFNNWFYGTTYNCYSEDKINIGIFDPTRLEILLANVDMDVTVCYVLTRDNIRLIRQLSREDFPNIEEIFRRYRADQEDFEDIEEFCPNLIYLPNNEPSDLVQAVQTLGALGKNG